MSRRQLEPISMLRVICTISLASISAAAFEACRPVNPDSSNTQAAVARHKSWFNGELDYYIFSFDNNPSTPGNRCWYYKEAPARSPAYDALSSAIRLNERELPDATLYRGFAGWAAANTVMAILDVPTAATCLGTLTPMAPIAIAGCGLAIFGLVSSMNDVKNNVAAGAKTASGEIDRKLSVSDFEVIQRLKEAINNSKNSESGNKCWKSNQVMERYQKYFKKSGK